MKTIDHDPNDGKRVPDFDRTWDERANGSKRTVWDALPWVAVVAGLYFARVGWPF